MPGARVVEAATLGVELSQALDLVSSLRGRLRTGQQRLVDLRRSAAHATPPEPLRQALAELRTSFDQLRTTQAELRRQNQELVRAQAAIDAERHRYRELFEAAPGAYLITDEYGTIREANRAAERLFASADRLLGRSLVSFAVPAERAAFARRFHPGGGGARSLRWETWCRGRSGRRFRAAVVLERVAPLAGRAPSLRWLIQDAGARYEAEERLREAGGRLLQSEEDERRRISHELHDVAAPNMASVAMLLAAVLKERPRALTGRSRSVIVEALELVEQCCRDLRSFSYLLHPPHLEDGGLASALAWYLRGFTARSSIRVELDVPPALRRLPRDTEGALFRVVQEALANLARHSGARKATIRLRVGGDAASLEVRDQGRGMAAGPGSRVGLGIAGMRERMRQLGGRLTIRTSARGTLVRGTFPLRGGAS